MHTRSAYAVDFYSLHTGETEPVHLTVGEEGETITVLRLLRPYEVFTCIECYRKAEVREERERLFRPELAQGVGPPPSRPAQP